MPTATTARAGKTPIKRATRKSSPVRFVVAKTSSGVTINGYKVLLPKGKSTLGRERIREAVREAVEEVAAKKK